MAPSGRRTTTSRTKAASTRKPRRPHSFKKQPVQRKNQETSTITLTSSSNNNSKKDVMGFDQGTIEVSSTSDCSTPKAQRFRIPEILTCPPAPKKQRVLSNCSLHRSPIAFFAPPDIELFFFFELRDIPV
ncbi:Cyclin-dependent protein kinase inhibitor SMR13 [Quillaja saponaria]|uniref:Cyclin-dependent protein kinase inhibitor SMR13 n=1 Tax=Quillaja saponaria TaxID=32244 RepID=A0AAD7LVB0_QUISA|nr:Cyclin-dependent protein kinase inhibitor SMR13 [Quillaja saponaria]